MVQENSKQHTHDAQLSDENPALSIIPKFEQSLKAVKKIHLDKMLRKQRKSFSTLVSSVIVGLSAGLTVVAILMTKKKFFD